MSKVSPGGAASLIVQDSSSSAEGASPSDDPNLPVDPAASGVEGGAPKSLEAKRSLIRGDDNEDPDSFERPNAFRKIFGDDASVLSGIQAQALAETRKGATGSAWKSIGPSVSYSAETVSPTPVSGRLNGIVTDPRDPQVSYVASAVGGVWKTVDAGKNWKPVTDTAPTLATGALALDPNHPDTLYVGLGDPFDARMPGLIKSTDGGKTWSDPVNLTGTPAGASAPLTATSTRDLKVSPEDSNVVFSATNVGLFRSEDAGKSFSRLQLPQVSGLPPALGTWSLAHVGPRSWLCSALATAGSIGQGMLYRSSDDGATWQAADLPTTDVGRMTIATSSQGAGRPARVYVLAANGSTTNRDQKDVFRSDDGGLTFTALGVNKTMQPVNPLPVNPDRGRSEQADMDLLHGQGWYNQMVAVDPTNPDNLIIGGNLNSARSNDGGKTWALESNWAPADNGLDTSRYVHADFHTATIVPNNGHLSVMVGTDGGLYTSNEDVFTGAPGAAKWDPTRNKGLSDFLAYQIGTDEKWDSNVVLGLQDNGTVLRRGMGTSYTETARGDGGAVAIGADPKVVLGSYYGAGYHVTSFDGGKTWDDNGAETGLPGTVEGFNVNYATVAGGKSFLTYEQDPVSDPGQPDDGSANPASGAVYRTTDGKSWSKAVGSVKTRDGQVLDHIPGHIIQVGAAPRNDQVWGALTDDGRAYTTADGGKNWSQSAVIDASAGPLGTLLSSIAFDPRDPTGKSYFVSVGAVYIKPGALGAYLFKTTDGGKTFNPVLDRGLPNAPILSVKTDPADGRFVFVGNVFGLYRSADGGSTWERYGKGLPVVPVSDIDVRSNGEALRISTYGRGAFELDRASRR